jgi:hypothetical protein
MNQISVQLCLAFLLFTCVGNSSIVASQWSHSEFYGKIGKNTKGYYSQWGQDQFMNEDFFHNKSDGISIDIGAHNRFICAHEDNELYQKN